MPDWFRQWVDAFRRDEDGVTAIEFGLVATPFFVIIIAIIETSLMFFNATLLEGAVSDASRAIRTGEVASQGDPQDAFRETVCDTVLTLPCDELLFEVRAFDDFGTAATAEPTYDDDGNLVPAGFNTGSGNQVIVARVTHNYQFITPLVGAVIAGNADSRIPLSAVAIFRNEPFDD
ncbi:MAG: hypothetical protein Alpg2KO_06270 [Alphaproteobacteria bacterium]